MFMCKKNSAKETWKAYAAAWVLRMDNFDDKTTIILIHWVYTVHRTVYDRLHIGILKVNQTVLLVYIER